MRKRSVSLRIPEIGFIAGTRVALGAGLGLILADKFNREQRRRTGWVLLAIGGLTTIPLVINVVRKAKESIATAA
jgi:multisubunit Na+/H+ antiporter MnhB subunit